MTGFFERYGRMIIVAVAICFVLLYLTPMRNVVGSSINCFALTSLDITKLITTNVTNMGNMFYGCRNLQEVDLSDLDTSNVTDMSSMFYHCYKLTKVKASQATYNNMNSLAEKNNKEVQDYIQLNPNKIEIVNK